MDSRIPAPSTAENATSAIPIMSAAAVAAVRPGLRIALRRASSPAVPAIRWPGRPSADASRGTSRGEISATPMNSSSEPGANSARRPSASMPGANMPSPSTPSASAPVIAANSGARRPMRPAGMSAPSRIAVTGETRVALSAGPRPANRVTMMPTASETMIVRAPKTVSVDGRSMPADANTPLRSLARPMPAASPISDATVPIASASTTTERSTWRRVAPSARSNASSRERCATVIESVL